MLLTAHSALPECTVLPGHRHWVVPPYCQLHKYHSLKSTSVPSPTQQRTHPPTEGYKHIFVRKGTRVRAMRRLVKPQDVVPPHRLFTAHRRRLEAQELFCAGTRRDSRPPGGARSPSGRPVHMTHEKAFGEDILEAVASSYRLGRNCTRSSITD